MSAVVFNMDSLKTVTWYSFISTVFVLITVTNTALAYSWTFTPSPYNRFFLHFYFLLQGEAMEQGLRDCCRSIRIGKILIQSDEETQRAKVYYAKFPPDIYRRKVLLMYPILSEWLKLDL